MDCIPKDIESMRSELAKTPYVCAFGYEMVKKKDVENAMIIADRGMYENKAKLKDTKERRIAAHKEAMIRVMHNRR